MPPQKNNINSDSPVSSRTRRSLIVAEEKCKDNHRLTKPANKVGKKRNASDNCFHSKDQPGKQQKLAHSKDKKATIKPMETTSENLKSGKVPKVSRWNKINIIPNVKKKELSTSSTVTVNCSDEESKVKYRCDNKKVLKNTGGSRTAVGQAAPNQRSDSEDETCPICMCPPENLKVLPKCFHAFCTECIDKCFEKMNPACPVCGEVYGTITGNQPQCGTMNTYVEKTLHLPSYEKHGTIVITYQFPDGKQTDEHPHPGIAFEGTFRRAYLPDNDEGRKVCKLLKRAFEARLVFTVGQSATTGLDDQVIWNDIHHKTNPFGGEHCFGYPDATYLQRVQEELALKGFK